jgi:hypothetical protein
MDPARVSTGRGFSLCRVLALSPARAGRVTVGTGMPHVLCRRPPRASNAGSLATWFPRLDRLRSTGFLPVAFDAARSGRSPAWV